MIEEPRLRDAAFKLFDPDNQMLMLRPEMTAPIARLVSQRLNNYPPPYKISYVLPVYRRANVGRGQSAELYQAGVEAIGSASPREDASTIALLVDTIASAGLSDCKIVLGQMALYEGFVRRVIPEAAPSLMGALLAKDFVAVDAISEALPDAAAAGVRELPRLVGPAVDSSILEEAARYVDGSKAETALEDLREILRHLEAHGCLESVILDLGLVGRFSYYTGAVFEAWSPALGFSIASGGRYDGLLDRFGKSLPATGFSISLERLLAVLPDQAQPPLLLLVGGGLEGTRSATELRGHGVPVLCVAEDLSAVEAGRYARGVDATWIGYPVNGGVRLMPAGVPAGSGDFEFTTTGEVAGRILS